MIRKNLFFCLFFLLSINLSFASEKTSWRELRSSQMSKNFIQLPVGNRDSSTGFVKVFLLQDFFITQSGANSMISLNEFDCSKNKVRVLRLEVYLQSMGNGLIADFEAPPKNREWEQIPKESFASEAIKIACQG